MYIINQKVFFQKVDLLKELTKLVHKDLSKQKEILSKLENWKATKTSIITHDETLVLKNDYYEAVTFVQDFRNAYFELIGDDILTDILNSGHNLTSEEKSMLFMGSFVNVNYFLELNKASEFFAHVETLKRYFSEVDILKNIEIIDLIKSIDATYFITEDI